jgi:hypothetical protein
MMMIIQEIINIITKWDNLVAVLFLSILLFSQSDDDDDDMIHRKKI